MVPQYNDPRLSDPQCSSLMPVETVHVNPWFAVRNRGSYFTVEDHRPQVLILPVVQGQGVILVRQMRPVVADATLELPAGGFEENELPVEAASRELAEETGVVIRETERFRPLLPMSIEPNRRPSLIHICRVDVMSFEFEARQKHDQEIESVFLYDNETIKHLIISGEIYTTACVAVLARYLFEIGENE